MLEGFTEDELFNMACDCQKKYEKKVTEPSKGTYWRDYLKRSDG